MRSWHNAQGTMACGYEQGCLIRSGEPYCLIQGKSWKKIRCAKHTSDPEPTDVPVRTEASNPSSFIAAKELARAIPKQVLRFDAKQAAAGKDE